MIGLNLRMTETTAAIAIVQLTKSEKIIDERVQLAEALTDAIRDVPRLLAPTARDGCYHVYYAWPILVDGTPEKVMAFRLAMNAEGVPLRPYSEPLYRLPAFRGLPLPVTEDIYNHLLLFEVCSYSPTKKQLSQTRDAFHKVIDNWDSLG